MAIRKIIYLPDARLRQPNASISVFDDNLQVLIEDMFETMYHAKGVGLAAPQIGINLRLSVIDTQEKPDKQSQLVLVNPEIIAYDGEMEYTEGCLSVPGAYDKVIRAKKVTIRALDRTGQPFEMSADGLLGECFQHEIDHLNGKLFVDLLSPIKQAIVRKKLAKFKRHQSRAS
jgi:peptide deformylase